MGRTGFQPVAAISEHGHKVSCSVFFLIKIDAARSESAAPAAGAIGEVSACEAAVRAAALVTPAQLEHIRNVDLPLLWQVAGPEGLGRVAEFEACLEAAVSP